MVCWKNTAKAGIGHINTIVKIERCPAPVEAAQLKVEEERGRIKKGRKAMAHRNALPNLACGSSRCYKVGCKKNISGQQVFDY